MRRLFILAFALFAATANSQNEIGADELESMFATVREMLREGREAVIAADLGLTSEERVAFWPVYDAYVADLGDVNDRLEALLLEYAAAWQDLSDDAAREMVDEYLDIEMDKLAVRSRYVRRFDDILPPKKLARFVQLENKLNVLVQLELAQAVPLVD